MHPSGHERDQLAPVGTFAVDVHARLAWTTAAIGKTLRRGQQPLDGAEQNLLHGDQRYPGAVQEPVLDLLRIPNSWTIGSREAAWIPLEHHRETHHPGDEDSRERDSPAAPTTAADSLPMVGKT